MRETKETRSSKPTTCSLPLNFSYIFIDKVKKKNWHTLHSREYKRETAPCPGEVFATFIKHCDTA